MTLHQVRRRRAGKRTSGPLAGRDKGVLSGTGVDTLMRLSFVSSASAREKDIAGCSALGPVSLVGTPVVVEVEVAIQGSLHCCGAEESPAELDTCSALRAVQCGCAPELAEDRALQPLDEALGPSMSRFGASVADTMLATDLVEDAPVFVALIAQDAPERPAGGPQPAGVARPRGRGRERVYAHQHPGPGAPHMRRSEERRGGGEGGG